MITKTSTDASCVDRERTSALPAIAAILALSLLILGPGNAAADDVPAADKGVCFVIPLDGQTTATTGGPMALADMTICYRALPEEFWAPSAPVLKAKATAPTAVSGPAPVDKSADPAAVAKPDPT